MLNRKILIEALLPTGKGAKSLALRELILELQADACNSEDQIHILRRELDDLSMEAAAVRRYNSDLEVKLEQLQEQLDKKQDQLDKVPYGIWQVLESNKQLQVRLKPDWMKANKIPAVKLVRELTNPGLKEAKDLIEGHIEDETACVVVGDRITVLNSVFDDNGDIRPGVEIQPVA